MCTLEINVFTFGFFFCVTVAFAVLDCKLKTFIKNVQTRVYNYRPCRCAKFSTMLKATVLMVEFIHRVLMIVGVPEYRSNTITKSRRLRISFFDAFPHATVYSVHHYRILVSVRTFHVYTCFVLIRFSVAFGNRNCYRKTI
jgi:hypothetical protein